MPEERRERGQAPLNPAEEGAPWLKVALVQSAWGGAQEDSYLQAQFQRLRARRGPKKAVCAAAAYHMLKNGTPYVDPGDHHFRKRTPATRAKALARQIERLGFSCAIALANPVSI